jgi:hypothetical protein
MTGSGAGAAARGQSPNWMSVPPFPFPLYSLLPGTLV